MRRVLSPGARSPRRGFTLIELVVVIMIIAIISGLVVSVLGWMRRSANYAAESHNQSALASNLELYRTTYGNNSYPSGFDSLLTSGGDVPTHMNSELAGMIDARAGTAGDFECLNSSGRGIIAIMRHTDPIDSTVVEGNPGNSGNIVESFSASPGGKLAFLKTTGATGSSLTNVNQLIAALFPAETTGGTPAVPADVSLVLMGVGPGCKANGRTLQSPPFDTQVDASVEYNRFIAVFAVYNPRQGRRAQLKAILSPRGRLQYRNLAEFWQSVNPE